MFTSQPAEANEALEILLYDGHDWRPGFAAPPDCIGAERFWLCLAGSVHHLFWQRASDALHIHHGWHDENRWCIGRGIELTQPVHDAFVGEINKQLIFAALHADPETPDQRQCAVRLWHTPDEADRDAYWHPPVWLEDEQARMLTVPAPTGIGSFSHNLVLLRPGAEAPQVGFWSTAGGPPNTPFRDVRLASLDADEEQFRGVREFASMLIVAGILLLLYWRRQESFSQPLLPPPGVSVVPPGRRAASALIDLAPALIVGVVFWRDPLVPFVQEFWAAATTQRRPEEFELLRRPEPVMWAWLPIRLIYTAYCTVFELAWGTTPGKRLLGSRVISESMSQPNWVQIGIRNITRLLELEPFLQFWPFLLVIVFTRNRQRVGDLLARTVVVHGEPVVEDDDDRDDDQAGDEEANEDEDEVATAKRQDAPDRDVSSAESSGNESMRRRCF